MNLFSRLLVNSPIGKSIVAAAKSESAELAGTRNVARERLQIILSRQRASNRLAQIDVAALQRDLLTTVQKYIPVSSEEVVLSVKKEGSLDVFEMQVVLAEAIAAAARAAQLGQVHVESHSHSHSHSVDVVDAEVENVEKKRPVRRARKAELAV
jgi:cell division topological specificity factor